MSGFMTNNPAASPDDRSQRRPAKSNDNPCQVPETLHENNFHHKAHILGGICTSPLLPMAQKTLHESNVHHKAHILRRICTSPLPPMVQKILDENKVYSIQESIVITQSLPDTQTLQLNPRPITSPC
jgi:hypothetical protein